MRISKDVLELLSQAVELGLIKTTDMGLLGNKMKRGYPTNDHAILVLGQAIRHHLNIINCTQAFGFLCESRADVVAIMVGPYSTHGSESMLPAMLQADQLEGKTADIICIDPLFRGGFRLCEDLSQGDEARVFTCDAYCPERGDLGVRAQKKQLFDMMDRTIPGMGEKLHRGYAPLVALFKQACARILQPGRDRQLLLFNFTYTQLLPLFHQVAVQHRACLGERLAVVQGYHHGQPVLVHSGDALLTYEADSKKRFALPVPDDLVLAIWDGIEGACEDLDGAHADVPSELGVCFQSINDLTMADCFQASLVPAHEGGRRSPLPVGRGSPMLLVADQAEPGLGDEPHVVAAADQHIASNGAH